MHKLIILIHDDCPTDRLDEYWPHFLRLAEKMPGLLRETTSRVDGLIYGEYGVQIIHELYFETRQALEDAMESPVGVEAGQTLGSITGGRMTLLFAQHQQEEAEFLRRYHASTDASGEAG